MCFIFEEVVFVQHSTSWGVLSYQTNTAKLACHLTGEFI